MKQWLENIWKLPIIQSVLLSKYISTQLSSQLSFHQGF